MKILRRFTIFVICAAILISFSGCKLGEREIYITGGSEFSAFSIDGMKCSKDEAKLYVASFADHFESMGELEIQTTEDSKKVIDGLVKDAALSLIARIYALNVYAKDNEIKLDTEEKENVKVAANRFYETLEEDTTATISYKQKDIENIYEKYAIALKVFDLLKKQSDAEITEDEGRVIDAYVIKLNSPEKCEELENRINRGDDFAVLTQVYSEGDKRIQSFGRNIYSKEVDEVAFSLENNEISPKINVDSDIYYIKCINKFNEIESRQNMEKIVKQSQKTLVSDIINYQKENYYSEVNMGFFEELNVSSIRVSCGDEFFDTIENTLGYSTISVE